MFILRMMITSLSGMGVLLLSLYIYNKDDRVVTLKEIGEET